MSTLIFATLVAMGLTSNLSTTPVNYQHCYNVTGNWVGAPTTQCDNPFNEGTHGKPTAKHKPPVVTPPAT